MPWLGLNWNAIFNSFLATRKIGTICQNKDSKDPKIWFGITNIILSYSDDRVLLHPVRGLQMSGPEGYQPYRFVSRAVHDFTVQDVTREMYLQPHWRHSWQTGGPSWSPRCWGSPWTGWWTSTRPRPFCQQRRRRHLLSDFREEITIFVLFTLIDIVLMLWHLVLT